MKTKVVLIALIPLILVASCKKDEEQNLFQVSGYLVSNGKSLSNATVNIDDLEQYKATTNSEGYFKIRDVSPGKHTLNTKNNYGDGTYIQRSFEIDLNTDMVLNELLLPNPVAIVQVFIDTVENKVTLAWNKSFAGDFREYKLYSHHSSGLDETTGTLEHVTTSADDTVFTLAMPNASTRYFRVFVLNEYGQLGGSNVEQATSSNKNLLTYGDFEDADKFFQTWNVGGNVFIVDTIQKVGNQCLLLMSEIDTVTPGWTICSFSHPQFLMEVNVEYELSFWYKARGMGQMMYPLYFYYKQDNETYLETIIGSDWTGTWVPLSPIKILDGVDWTYYSVTFFPTGSAAIQFFFEGNIDELYFDQVQLKKKL